MLQAQYFLGVILFIFGSLLFRFLNIIIYRIPRFASFGKCHYCTAKLSGRRSLIEVLGGIAALLCWWKFGFSAAAANIFAFLAILSVIAFLDMDTMEIPNELNLCVFLLGILSVFTMSQPPLLSRMIGLFAASVPMLAIAVIMPGGFGGGDIKLMAASGLLLGWKLNLAAVFAAIFTGGIYACVLLLQKKAGRKDHFPFAPFLCFGMALVLFAGNPFITCCHNIFRIF